MSKSLPMTSSDIYITERQPDFLSNVWFPPDSLFDTVLLRLSTDLLLVRQTTTLWGNNKTLWNISSAFVVSVGPFEDALKLHEACGVGSTISGGSGAEGGVGGGRVLEDQWPSPPRRRAPVAPNEEQLRREPWYHSRMSRRDAEKLLSRDGDFLVRESTTNPGQYVLSGLHRGLPKHLLLVDPEGVVSLLRSSFNKSHCLFVLLWSYTGVLLLFCFSLQKKGPDQRHVIWEHNPPRLVSPEEWAAYCSSREWASSQTGCEEEAVNYLDLCGTKIAVYTMDFSNQIHE